jgi:hypothetical protein
MKKHTKTKNGCVLAIAPSSRGFGFAVLEHGKTLVDWGVKSVEGDKNAGCIEKVESMIAHYNPGVLVLPDTAAKGARRSPRIRSLCAQVAVRASKRQIKVAPLSRDNVRSAFFEDGKGTKHTIAKHLAVQFSKELGHRLPPKRKPWKSEDYRMEIFDAVALAAAHELVQRRNAGSCP